MMKNILKRLTLWSLCLLLAPAWAAERTTYYHLDLLGSPAAATDRTGQVQWREEYKPYGERILKQAASTENALWYTGKAHDESMGLSYFGARWHDPELGRFTGIDPVGVQEDNIHSFNRYAYANNNPYKFVDPDGRAVETAVDIVSLGLSISQFKQDPGVINGLGVAYDGLATVVPFLPAGFGIIKSAGNIADGVGDVAKGAGRSGKQARLRELANDPKLGKADRGWIKQEQNSIDRGNRKTIRNPPGKDLAHERGREAAKGYGYKYSNLQDIKLHRTQHKYDNFGRKNTERPPQ
jgi:RHS repeat-associated protein